MASVIVTDGRVAVIKMKACDPAPANELADSSRPPSMKSGVRLIRRMVLESRQAVERGNVYYWGYRLGEQSWKRAHLRYDSKIDLDNSSAEAGAQRNQDDY
jgi:hypothetical protein